MMKEENFRRRVQIVRQSARAHLLDIRRARLAKRRPLAEAEPAPQDDIAGKASANPVVEQVAEPDEPVTVVLPDSPEVAPEPALPVPKAVAKVRHDDIDQVAVKSLAASKAPSREADLPLLLVMPVVRPAPNQTAPNQTTSGKPLAEKKVAKPKVRKNVSAAVLSEDCDDRAIRSAALADLAGEPRLGSPVAVAPAVMAAKAALDLAEPDFAEALDALVGDVAVEEPFSAELSPAGQVPDPLDQKSAPPTETLAAVSHEPVEGGIAGLHTSDESTAGEIVTMTETIPAMPNSDLRNLPGAGPGLLWMLQQCDIHTLQDLAETEAAVLVPKLGLVGQILNVEIWLDYAKKSQQPRL